MPCFQAILPDRRLELTIPRSRLMNERILSITIEPLEEVATWPPAMISRG